MEKLKELFTAFSGGLVAVVFLVYALAMYCIAGIAVSDITGWDWLGFIAAPIFIFLRMTFLPAGLAAWALYDVYHFNPFLAILIALPRTCMDADRRGRISHRRFIRATQEK